MSDPDDYAKLCEVYVRLRGLLVTECERLGVPPSDWRYIGEALMKEAISEAPQRVRSMPYNEYLKTAHWQEMRLDVFEAQGRRCATCQSTERLHVHHLTYERLGAELPSDLVVLCSRCHDAVHRTGGAHRPKAMRGAAS